MPLSDGHICILDVLARTTLEMHDARQLVTTLCVLGHRLGKGLGFLLGLAYWILLHGGSC